MNLDRYRSSFTVFVAISDVNLGRAAADQLEQAGYVSEIRSNLESLAEEIIRNPPHVILMSYGDRNFFTSDGVYKERLESLLTKLPELQIIFLSSRAQLNNCANLYEFGIYDCLCWPLEHPRQLLRAVDRACETNYYLYLNEHLREQSGQRGRALDLGLYQVWLKEVDGTYDREQSIGLFLREAVRYLQNGEGFYFRYRELHHTLILAQSTGVTHEEFEGVGLDLAALEPGFVPALLTRPHQLYALQEFVTKGLGRKQAIILPLQYRDQVLGIFLLPARSNQVFRDDGQDDAYLSTCLMALKRHFEIQDLKERLDRLTVYDYESEAFNPEVIVTKLREEVVRARRILKPAAALMIQIDGLADLSLAQTPETTRLFLKGFHEVLKKNSRLNDLIGRMSLDQFVLCLPHTSWRGATVKAERLRRIIESADFSSIIGTSQKITVSIGLSEYPSLCQDADELLKSAESALTEIMRTGRNRVGIAVQPPRFVPDFVVTDDQYVSPSAG